LKFSAFLIYLIPPAFFGAALFVGYRLGLRKSGLSFALIAPIWIGLTWFTLIEAQSKESWDGIGYVILIVGVNAPIGAGLLIGGLFGWFKKSE
jgi:predicted permease